MEAGDAECRCATHHSRQRIYIYPVGLPGRPNRTSLTSLLSTTENGNNTVSYIAVWMDAASEC